MVAGDDDDPDARPPAAGDGLGDVRAGRVLECREPQEGEMGFRAVALFVGVGARHFPLREAEDAQPLARVALERPANLLAVLLRQGPVGAVRRRAWRRTAPRSSSGAPLTWYQRLPSGSSSAVVIRLTLASKW